MSEFELVEKEIRQIDELLADSYLFKTVHENLEGAFVTFIQQESGEERILHIKMADTRKYFSSKLHEQLQRLNADSLSAK